MEVLTSGGWLACVCSLLAWLSSVAYLYDVLAMVA